jgi:hypothetical protein
MSAPVIRAGQRGRPQGGPPPLVPALAYGALMIAAVALSAGGPQPGTSAAATLSYAQAHAGQLHVAAVLTFGAAAPLAIWAATIYRRLHTLGVTAPGTVIGLAGGILAAASIALSGLLTWVAAEVAADAGPALARVVFDLSFAAGAAGFVVPFALLVAGVAVPSLILRLTPRWLAWAGLVIAAAGVLSTLTLLTSALDATLPVGRFGGLIWIVAVSVLLPASRRRLPARAGEPAPAAA